MAVLDWELGDAIFWVAFGTEKPFPVSLFRQNGSWGHHAYPTRELTHEEKKAIERFAGERVRDCLQQWKPNMTNRLHWDQQHNTRKKR